MSMNSRGSLLNFNAPVMASRAVSQLASELGLSLQKRQDYVYLCTLSTIIDSETSWILQREWSIVANNPKRLFHYAYDVFAYDKNKYLGNRPPFSRRSLDEDPVRFRGSFGCHLTGRYNFVKYLPPSVAVYFRLYRPVIKLFDPQFNALLFKAKLQPARLTNADIDVLASNYEFFLSVAVAKIGVDSGIYPWDVPDLPSGELATKLLRPIGYPSRDKVWPDGSVTRGIKFSVNKVKRLYNYNLNLNNS